jgi:hypothetical protein
VRFLALKLSYRCRSARSAPHECTTALPAIHFYCRRATSNGTRASRSR